jgi:hypothetical protein
MYRKVFNFSQGAAAANVLRSSTIIFTLMMEALRCSERLFLQEPLGVTSQRAVIVIVTAV